MSSAQNAQSVQPDGYLAVPASGKGSPVLVLHAWWGLNDTFKSVCNRLAESGFIAFAPDLYHGKVTDQIPEAGTLVEALGANINQARADIAEAVKFLKERAGSGDSGIAVIGFSMGANYAIDLSINAPDDIRSVVIFYGAGPIDFDKSKAAYLGHFAENDQYEDAAYIKSMEDALRSAGRPVTFYQYEGTGHWFFEPDRADVYNPAASKLAWERTLTFLKRS